MKILVFFLFPIVCVAKPALLSFGVGVFDIQREKYRTSEYRIEYKSSYALANLIRPMVGAMITAKQALYLYGGFGLDFVSRSHIVLSPNFAAGYYRRGNGKKLGYPLEFRTGIEIGYEFCNKSRLGVHFYHISNAGLSHRDGHRNPGEESLVLFYSIPIY